MKIDDYYGVITNDLFRDGWRVDEKISHYLFFYYLRLSPTYELARKFNEEGLTRQEKKSLPKDFKKVLETYDLLGNVNKIFYRDWWARVGNDIFGVPYEYPTVNVISLLTHEKASPESNVSELSKYIDNAWVKQGKTPTVVMAIPLDNDVNSRLKFVREFLGHYRREKNKPKKLIKPKLSLQGERINERALIKGIALTTFKGSFSDFSNWQLGVVTKFSNSYSSRLNWKNPRRTKDSVEEDDRVKLGNVVSRAIKKYERIIENAARGKFPCDAPIEYSPFDYQALSKRHEYHQAWEEKELNRLKAKSNS